MGRSPCCEKAHMNKGAWTKEEDDRLIAYIRAHGEGCWRSLPKAAGLLRCGKSCRLRWINYLRPDLKRGNFTEEEDELIIKLHSLLGNKRKLLNRGIDPSTHRPINELPASTGEPVTNISFSSAAAMVSRVHHQEKKADNAEGFKIKLEEKNPAHQEQCPDLNLELRISPPHQTQYPQADQPMKSGGRNHLCFVCSLGLQNSKECSCNISGGRGSGASSSYDFLGLKTGVLDYRSLEMK
ncbi:hypothetical protein CRG98_026696 [Punica granatum]|uniref:Myb-related protein 308-like n=1 Tax=Punica granatum TaxID=22663 RepID=A0A2I0J9D5_PUNGR|nr:hypothetical protein CRG98_026696 [Punica granatum]